jgi:hypothetical protein
MSDQTYTDRYGYLFARMLALDFVVRTATVAGKFCLHMRSSCRDRCYRNDEMMARRTLNSFASVLIWYRVLLIAFDADCFDWHRSILALPLPATDRGLRCL